MRLLKYWAESYRRALLSIGTLSSVPNLRGFCLFPLSSTSMRHGSAKQDRKPMRRFSRVSGRFTAALRLLSLEGLESRCLLSTLYVATNGNDSSAGTSSSPWQTLQKAVNSAKAGDVIIVKAGTYNQGANMFGLTGGTQSNPITIEADPNATPGSVIVTHCATTGTNADAAAFNVESTGTWVIEGFTINSDGSMQKSGIRVATANYCQILDNTVNRAFTGIFVSGATSTLIQGNLCENSTDQHGIYISLNTNGTIVRGNTLTGNNWDGLHMNCLNGSPNQNAIVEDNVIYGNNLAGMDLEGISNATIRNNIIYGNTKHGITIHSQDQTNTPATMNNTFVNNTIVNNGMFGIQMQSADTQETIFNNIILCSNTTYGSIGVSGNPSGLVSDYNIVSDNFSTTLGTSQMTFASWKSSTGNDAHSIIGSMSVFTSSSNFHLKSGSIAIDAGAASVNGKNAPASDFDGNSRPQGSGYDIGAFEFNSTPDTTPPTLSAITSSVLISSTGTITWTTNEGSSSQVQYGTSSSYGLTSTLNSTLDTSHSVTLNGLTGNTTYHYRVVSTDAAGNQSVSADLTFTTPVQDVTPPTLSNIQVISLSPVTEEIIWTTNEASDAQLKFGTTTSYGTTTTLNTTLATSHTVTLSNLSPNTTYHFAVLSHDASGNLATSSDQTFATPVLGTGPFTIFAPTTVPDPSIIATDDSASYVLGVKFTSDLAGVITGIRFYKAATNTGTHIGYLWSSTGTLLASATFTNESASGWQQVNFSTPVAITANTTYVAGYYDPNGNYAMGTNELTNAGIDNYPLHITQSTTNSGNGLYNQGGAGVFPTSTWMDSDYYIDVSFSTSVNDTTPPTLSSINATGLTSTGATITWTTNEASDTQVQYGTSTSYGSTTTLNSSLVTSHSVSLSGLPAGTVIHYRVLSKDASGNLATSADQTFTTTTVDSTAPTASLTAGNLTSGGGTYTFTVTYSDNIAVNVSTLNSSDIVVTGPNSFSQAATFVSVDTNSNGTPRTATYRITAPGGTWDLTDNGTYTIALQASQVADTSGNFAAAGSLGTFAVNIADIAAPTASLTATNLTSSTGTTYTFTVTYADNVAVNVASLNSSDLVVTGPNSFSQAATFVSVNNTANGTTRTATYRITAPGGTWDLSDNGTYTVSLQSGQVTDTSGNAATAGSLGTFAVNIPDNIAPTASILLSNITSSGASTYTFTVLYTDNVAINVASLGSTDIQVTGPNGFSQLATFVSTNNNSNGAIRTATYSFNAPGGSWDIADNGTYTVALRAGEVTDTSGNAVAAGSSTFSASITAVNQLLGEYVFYKGSTAYDSGTDDAAIAIDKSALLPGQTATFANYTSFDKGINGIMFDISGNVSNLSASDLLFSIGNDNNPAGWTTAPAAASITVRPGAGANGSNRVEIVWADNAIQNEWLQVTVLADQATGLSSNSVFYFGNQIGETGDSTTDAQVTSQDQALVLANPASAIDQIPITNHYDFNRDGNVDASDAAIALANTTSLGTGLSLIAVPGTTPTGPAPSVQINGPVLSSIAASNLSNTTATINWNTDDSSDARVLFGTSSALGFTTTEFTSLATGHAINLTGLQPGMTYYYCLRSRDAAGNLTVSQDFTFTTPGGVTPSSILGTVSTGTSLRTSASTIGLGQQLTLSAVATSNSHIARTGSITFMDGTNVLGVVQLDGNSSASLTVTPSPMGRHSYTAVYSGDTTFKASKSYTKVVTVGKVRDSIPLTSPTPAPITTGAAVVLNVTVTTPVVSNGVPVGTVTFKDGRKVLGTATLDGSGHATLTTAFTTTGRHSITAVYSGDTLNLSGTSLTLVESVTAAATAVVVNASLAPVGSSGGSSAPATTAQVFTATVSRTDATGVVPTGRVVFRDGTKVLATVTLVNGQAVLTTTATILTGVTATYLGDPRDLTSVSTMIAPATA